MRLNEVNYVVFNNPIIGNENWIQILKVLSFSFRLSLSVVFFDLIFGIPLAYILVRKEFSGKSLLEDIVTLPLVIPTSGFGFATLITWTTVTVMIVILTILISYSSHIYLNKTPLDNKVMAQTMTLNNEKVVKEEEIKFTTEGASSKSTLINNKIECNHDGVI